jgi:acyl-homoserine lactone acylase PvdQ
MTILRRRRNVIRRPSGGILLMLLIWATVGCTEHRVTGADAAPAVEILWDRYGVPHIYGSDEALVFYGFGWAQAHSHADIVLRLYGQARARGAEYWGPEYEAEDRWLLAHGAPARAAHWYDEQTPQFRANLDAFAQGINDYAAAHPERIATELAPVLPVTGIDVVAHAHRLMNFVYVTSRAAVLEQPVAGVTAGSNAWAVAPARTANGHTLLLANPHLPWAAGYFTYYEAHKIGPDFEMYGATQVGLPVIRFAFNRQMGIANTVNNLPGATTYALVPDGDGYRFDGESRAFSETSLSYRVREPDGSLCEVPLTVRHSVHGPVFERDDGRLVAVRVAGLDRPGMLAQYFDMLRARDFAEFRAVMARLQIPTFNIVYADRDGHIMYVYNGILPVREQGDLAFWRGLVPGDRVEYLWERIHPFHELPQVIDPPSGFVQNANDPPWLATWPAAYAHTDYPPYVAPAGPFSLRALQSVRMLLEAEPLTLTELTRRKLSTHALMADRVLPELLAAAASESDPALQAAVELLSAWDRRFDADSRAALLFETWAGLFAGPQFQSQAPYARPWSADDPLETPVGIADPAAAVAQLRDAIELTRQRYGAIDTRFGEVSRFELDGRNVPGHGGFGNLGIFRVMTWAETDERGQRTPRHGETWVALVEFSEPLRALGLMSYGNARQPGTAHFNDQLDMLANSEFRELWIDRDRIEANLSRRETLTPGRGENGHQTPPAP